MDTVPTYQATICCGLRESYDGITHHLLEVAALCREYVDEIGLCVTLTDTVFIYSHGREPGVLVGLINYPRFPLDVETIKAHALILARKFKEAFKQIRISVICTDETITI